MAWLLPTLTAVLALLVLALAVLTLRMRTRLAALEGRSPAGSPSSDAGWSSSSVPGDQLASLDDGRAAPEFVITQVGEPVEEPEPVPVRTVAGPVFADLVLRETVVQTAALAQGLRRALAPEARNRIRFQMRQEVKRSRKQRRTELREVRREWAARQRASMGAEETPA